MANSCKDCKHDKGKCVGVSRSGSRRYCFEQKEMTNADRIRAMSDEELCNAIKKTYIGMAPWCDHHCTLDDDCKCNTCLKEWLKQPAEV